MVKKIIYMMIGMVLHNGQTIVQIDGFYLHDYNHKGISCACKNARARHDCYVEYRATMRYFLPVDS
jgi:hypothetical protein